MSDIEGLLHLAKQVASKAGARLLESTGEENKRYVHCLDNPKEVKAIVDLALEKEILQGLAVAGLAILSEESGHVPPRRESRYCFLVDPLDGTFNFVKGLGPCAVSIALWEDLRPVFGVIYSLTERRLAWGGPGIGSHAGERRIYVSNTSNRAHASLCTGFPVRLDVASPGAKAEFWRLIEPFAKIRMLGSAAMSLLQVARGSADAYAEASIMLWDVAAGLAIVEGAGGNSSITPTKRPWCYDVIASNFFLWPQISGCSAHAERGRQPPDPPS